MSLIAILMAGGMLLAVEAPPGPVEGDAQDIVFLGPDRPVIVRLHLQVEGQGFRRLQPALVERLFDLFDADHDRAWSKDEQGAAEKSGRLLILGNDATFDANALDANRNGRLDRDEFVAHALPALGPPLIVRADTQSPSKSLPLFEKVDDDENGRLSAGELRQAWHALRKLDLDDDELLSLTELLPPEITAAQPGTPVAGRVELPVVALTPEAVSNLARTLLQRYGAKGRSRMPLKALELPEKSVRPFDKDGDGHLSRAELTKFLEQPAAHQEVLVRLPRGKGGRISLHSLSGSRAEGRGATTLQIRSGSFVSEIRGASTAAAVADNRAFYRIQFRRSDNDKNKYLDEMEYAGVNGTVPFAQVDRNGDKMITEQELLEHLSIDDQLNESRIELLVGNDGRSLFELMDTSFDQRISPREFSDAAGRLMPRDQNGDGQLDSGELDNRVRLAVSLDRPKLFQSTGTMAPRPPMTGRPARPKVDAPDWFLKMDRNRDGDVSSREFLGPAGTFARLDADHNGVLDPSEAAAAK